MIKTRVLRTDDPQAIPNAVDVINNQGLIAFPTDTIYGIAVDPFSASAINKLYLAKERPEGKALPVLISDLGQLETLVLFISERVKRIADAFWPGALTLILPKHSSLPKNLSPYSTIGVRMPDLAFTLKLLRQTGPLATTSANLSGRADPLTAEDVLSQLRGRVDLILDGGATLGGRASTVLDITGNEMKILRQGPITLSEIQALLEEE
jgi:L-threonylcarbamoyladenylate synthase